jgi:acyl-CoA thioesterase-2
MCDLPDSGPEARQRNWLRVRGALPENPLIHTAMLVYASDRTLLGTAARPHDIPWNKRMAASLDHAMWIHRPVRMDDWILYAAESPVAHSARGLCFGGLFYPDGTRVASVAQEALIRRARD